MKKRLMLFILCLIVITVAFLICSFSPQKPFENLNPEEITSAHVTLAPPGRTVEIEDVNELMTKINEIVVYNRVFSEEDEFGQWVEYDINKQNGDYVNIVIRSHYIIIDGKTYKSEYNLCNELNAYVNSVSNKFLITNYSEELYSYRNTPITDESKISALINAVNLTEFPIEKIEFNMGIEIFLKVTDRAKHRYINDMDFSSMVALVFSLAPEADELKFFLFDDYAKELKETEAFYGAYFSREQLHTRKEMERFNKEFIENSTKIPANFKEYCNAVATVTEIKEVNPFLDKVYEFIGDDYEITPNSAIAANIDLNSEFLESNDRKTLDQIFDLNLAEYKGKQIRLIKYDIRNFKNGKREKCAFLHFDYISKGTEILGQKILEKKQIQIIREIIVKNN